MSPTTLNAARGSEGFTAEVTGAEARRQLRMSLGVVAVLAVGIVSAAVSIGPHPLAARRAVTSTAPITLLHAETAAVGARAI